MSDGGKINHIDIGSDLPDLNKNASEKDELVSEVIVKLAEKSLKFDFDLDLGKDEEQQKVDDILNVLNLLEKIYVVEDEEHRFRHSYSNIFNTMVRLVPSEKNKYSEALDEKLEILSVNIDWIRYLLNNNGIGKEGALDSKLKTLGKNSIFNKGFFKLYDHILLEAARIRFSVDLTKQLHNIQKELAKLDDELKKNHEESSQLQEKIEKIRNTINEEEKKAEAIKQDTETLKQNTETLKQETKGMQRKYVGILGIFAAIITAFFSGIGFSSSVLANMHEVSIYRLLLRLITENWGIRNLRQNLKTEKRY